MKKHKVDENIGQIFEVNNNLVTLYNSKILVEFGPVRGETFEPNGQMETPTDSVI